MTTRAKADYFAAVVVALLLILTTWGNAWLMLVASLVGLLVSIALFRKEVFKGGAFWRRPWRVSWLSSLLL